MKKTDPARMAEVLAVLLETIRQLAILIQPIMPASAAKLLDQLLIEEGARDFAVIGGAGRIVSGQTIAKPEGVFPRFMDEKGEGH